MKNTKINRNEPCPCGSGKKYKRCCWGKVIENNQDIEPRDADQLLVKQFFSLNVTYDAEITLKSGQKRLGKRVLKCFVPNNMKIPIPEELNNFEMALNYWDGSMESYCSKHLLDDLKSKNGIIIFDGKQIYFDKLADISDDGELYDEDDNPIINYQSFHCKSTPVYTCNPGDALDIAFVNSTSGQEIFLSSILNVVPFSLRRNNPLFLLDAVKFFRSDSLQKNLIYLQGNSFNPDEKIFDSLNAIAKYYGNMKHGREYDQKESEQFAKEAIENHPEGDVLWWKTIELHFDMLMDNESVASGRRDTMINEWLIRMVLHEDYGKEENDIRFEAAQNWFWDDFKKNHKSFWQIQEDKISELPRPFRKIMNNPKTSYIFAYDGNIGAGQHANFTKRERQILIEVFRNPENYITYFRNLILTDMTNFNIVPANYIDDLFWNTAADFSEDELHQPISFVLPRARIPLFKVVDAQKVKDVLFDEGMIGLKQLLTLTIAPKGIFSQAGIHNPKLDRNIDAFLSFYHDKYPAMIEKFEEIYRIYGSKPIIDLSENSFRFYFGNKFASENAQFIKSHLEILEEYREQILTQVS